MQTFLVGGAVRDRLLSIPVVEKDWVVIGETSESMVAQGFRPIGKDFPVFLHPSSHEEYALARSERKTAPGYKGFAVAATPDITLEQDLIRRDLTINAIAEDENGNLVDPYGGEHDLQNRLLRHISPAFSEDPVRVLRVARFAARFSHLGFAIAPETMELMRQMVTNGETCHLVAERVWAELQKSLTEKTPAAFFYTLRQCGALAVIFPEIDQLYGVPQPPKYHPEIDTGVHSLLCLEQAAKLTTSRKVRLAALLHDLGKAATDPTKWPSHHGHEQLGLPILDNFAARLRLPKKIKAFCAGVMRYHTNCHRIFEMRPATIVDMFTALGVFSDDNCIEDFALACEADARGRTGLEQDPYPQASHLLNMATACQNCDSAQIVSSGLQGSEIGAAIRRLRIATVADFVRSAKIAN